MLPPPVLCAVLAKLKLVTVHGPWWRVVAFRFLLKKPADPLYAAGSKIDGARFTPKDGFDSLYLTGDQVTALAEVNSLVLLPGGPKSVPIPPCTLFAVEGVVSRVLDLTDAATLAALGTDEQEMTGPWATLLSPPTQIMGQLAYDTGLVAGIQYGSAKHAGTKNLVAFPDRLISLKTNYLEVHDPDGNLTQRLGA